MSDNSIVFDDICIARDVLDLIADKWTLLVVYALANGTKRYSQIYRRIGCITHKMLAQTLRRLEGNGLLSRKVYPVIPPKTEYTLTPLGMTLLQPIHALFHWGEEHLDTVYKARSDSDAMEHTVDQQ